ncbi:MAG: naphthalene 1,2-dioxygenase [Burkholderiales bacterium]|nr:naphthalene 1,2-dioxygenase [Burkholderiales bacterium]
MHNSGRALADATPAGAGDSNLEQRLEAAMPLTGQGQRDCGNRAKSAAHPARVMLCRVDSLTDLSHDTSELRLAIEDGGRFGFFAGQYAQIEFAPEFCRYYSMASTPAEEQLLFHLRRTPGGTAGSYVAQQLKPGDKVKVSGPLGSSYLRDEHTGPVLLIAGGSGLAPMLSILRTLLAREVSRRVVLYFGVRSERDVYHERLLAGLAEDHDNFSYAIVLSEPDGASSRRRGLVHQAVADDLADASAYTVYLAGPTAMVEAAGKLLLGRGVAGCDIHGDAFRYPPPGP